jgi:hypothetical protein
MADRRAYILKRRSVLKGQVTKLHEAITNHTLDPRNIKERFDRLTELFHQYEEFHIELELLEESPENAQQFEEVQDRYYELRTLVASLRPSEGSNSNTADANASRAANIFANSTLIERQKSVKLPVAELPKFDGSYNAWLSFKNTFKAMIDSRTDLDDLNKFIYLRNSLTGAAAKKLALFDASPENYKKGWDLLTDLYEKKRLLIASHYSAIFDNGYSKIYPMQTVSTEALSKLIDDAQQHISMLESLQVVPDEGMIVCFLEKALPQEVRREWEKTLEADSMPNFKQFYKFIHGHVTQIISLDADSAQSRGGKSGKRPQEQTTQNAKARRSQSGTRTFITSTSNACGYCGQDHLIHKCTDFGKLNVPQRWEAVKSKSLCYNCLRGHKGACKSTHCKKCDKFHNTLLHNEKKPPASNNNNAKANNNKATSNEGNSI